MEEVTDPGVGRGVGGEGWEGGGGGGGGGVLASLFPDVGIPFL